MLGDIIGEAIGVIFRFIGWIFSQFLFEFVFHGTGQALLRLFQPKAKPDGLLCGIVGLSFWLYRHLAAA